MKNVSYTKTTALNEQLIKIEDLRKELLLKPLSPRQELRLQWETTTKYIHYVLGLSNIIIPQELIAKLFSPEGKKHLTGQEKQVVRVKQVLDYLYHNWLVNPAPITAESLIEQYKMVFEEAPNISTQELISTLRYVQINPEYPVIQAALAQFMIYDLFPSDLVGEEKVRAEIFSHIVFLMFLYKNGYDFRRMVVPEEYFFRDMNHYKDLITKLRKQSNITEWLEYITASYGEQLAQVLKEIAVEKQPRTFYQNALQLNDRQEAILKFMERPNTKINNSMVQKLYKISQITASRDLAKLTSLGLLFPLGKGRSTYYTRV